MALKDSIKQFGRFIGVLQPNGQGQAPMYDGYGYPPDDGGYYGGQYDAAQYDGAGYGGAPSGGYPNNAYPNNSYPTNGYPNNGASQADPRYGGVSPMSQSMGGQRPYAGEDEYPPSPQVNQRPMTSSAQPSSQPFSVFSNNQRSKHPPNNVVPLVRTEDGSVQRTSSKHSEIIICVRGLEDCQEIINALLESKSVFINMEPMDDLMAQRVIDMLGGASFALRGTMAKISHRTYLLAPHTVDVVNSQVSAPGPQFRGEFSALRR